MFHLIISDITEECQRKYQSDKIINNDDIKNQFQIEQFSFSIQSIE